MKTWTVANQKGGVGKTTTVVSLGGLLAARGFRTLLVDMDPHGSLTSYFKYDQDHLEDTVYSLFEAASQKMPLHPERVLYGTGTEGLELMPAEMGLATLDRQAGKLGGLGLVLKQALAEMGNRFDHVLIDCPPVLGVLMINALAACDRLLIPVQTEFLALKGLERMVHTLNMVLKARKSELPFVIVPTLYDRRTRASVDTLKTLRQSYPQYAWDGVIPVDTHFREASKAGLPPAIYDRGSRGVLAYDTLLEYLLQGPEKVIPSMGELQ